MKELSILIPTLPIRIETYSELIKELIRQIKLYNLEDKVQILTFCDTKEYTVGFKRNWLLNNSVGKYVCFIDDDDKISTDYLLEITKLIDYNLDCITFNGEYIENGLKKDFIITTMNSNYDEANCFYRKPNHLCPVKREIALKCLFTDKNFGEDSDYSDMINKFIKDEYHIPKKLYFYMFDNLKSQTSPNNINKKTF
jgi:glycosyltransferase involved in cell wall biosynthesis